MVRGWKSISLGIAWTASLTQASVVKAECPCHKSNIRMISQSAPTPGVPIAPVPMPPVPSDALSPTLAPGLPPAPPPGTTAQPTPVFKPSLVPSPPLERGMPPVGPGVSSTPMTIDGTPMVMDRPGTDRFGMTPPPGTLGRTYHQRSRIFDDEKNPRMAAVDVYLPENVDVSARGMKSIWTGKHWRLEVKDPLLPGVPHIYAIKAERKTPEGEVASTDVRWIRLIPGRIVDLRF